jgi:hypothetical protein
MQLAKTLWYLIAVLLVAIVGVCGTRSPSSQQQSKEKLVAALQQDKNTKQKAENAKKAAYKSMLTTRTETQSASAPLPVEPTTDTSPTKPAASAEPARDTATAVAKPELRKLKGRWRRPDGQYILEVRDVDESGKVDAAYFNPKPIRVGRAMAKQEAGAATLFVELRDTGYPGCTYSLVYDPKSDQLAGIYYQAAMQEQYEVVFERIN